jgi:uncharacterized protein YbaR (Trm112 family)
MPIPNIVWILPRPRRTRYPGGFPLHFEKKLIELLKPPGLILQPFAGDVEYGLKVDINPEMEPDVIADAHYLPFKDNTFSLVICDPPYNKDYASSLYNARPARYNQYIKEAVRVCEPSGYVVSYHWALTPRPPGAAYWCRIFIAGRVWHRPRVACVFRKEQNGMVLPAYQEAKQRKSIKGLPQLLEILACPLCKGNLELKVQRQERDSALDGCLYCKNCSKAYPVNNGRPNLLPSKKDIKNFEALTKTTALQ